MDWIRWFGGWAMWDKGYDCRKCWDERIGKDHEMKMLSRSTLENVVMDDKKM